MLWYGDHPVGWDVLFVISLAQSSYVGLTELSRGQAFDIQFRWSPPCLLVSRIIQVNQKWPCSVLQGRLCVTWSSCFVGTAVGISMTLSSPFIDADATLSHNLLALRFSILFSPFQRQKRDPVRTDIARGTIRDRARIISKFSSV